MRGESGVVRGKRRPGISQSRVGPRKGNQQARNEKQGGPRCALQKPFLSLLTRGTASSHTLDSGFCQSEDVWINLFL